MPRGSRRNLSPIERDEAYGRDILHAVDRLRQYISHSTVDQFKANEMLQDAVLRKLNVIGEAAAKLSDDFKRSHRAVPWSKIAGMRNLTIHQYWQVDVDVVWTAATASAPELGRYMRTLFVDDGS